MVRSGMFSLLCVISLVDATQLWSTQNSLPEANRNKDEGLRIKKSTAMSSIVQVDHQEIAAVVAEEDDDFSPAKEPTSQFRLIVKAKVNKVMAWLREHSEEYSSADTERKTELEHQGKQEVMHHAGTRGFSMEYCQELWNESTEFASQMTYYFCPDLRFPETDGDQPTYPSLLSMPGSPIRSAYLSQYFWLAVIRNHPDAIKMCSQDVEYWNGQTYIGLDRVRMIISVIGFPSYTQLADPSEWRCSDQACLVPITAWAHTKCSAYSKFNAAGKVTLIHIPMGCWR